MLSLKAVWVRINLKHVNATFVQGFFSLLHSFYLALREMCRVDRASRRSRWTSLRLTYIVFFVKWHDFFCGSLFPGWFRYLTRKSGFQRCIDIICILIQFPDVWPVMFNVLSTRWINHFLSGVCTSLSPNFIASCFFRSFLTFSKVEWTCYVCFWRFNESWIIQ